MTDEQVTFDGIPIPLTLETILSAMVKAKIGDKYWLSDCIKRDRQYRAFRARILEINARKDDEIGEIGHYFDYVFEQLEDCRKEIIEKDIALEMIEAGYNGLHYEKTKQLAEKDHEIRVLKKYIKDHGYKRL